MGIHLALQRTHSLGQALGLLSIETDPQKFLGQFGAYACGFGALHALRPDLVNELVIQRAQPWKAFPDPVEVRVWLRISPLRGDVGRLFVRIQNDHATACYHPRLVTGNVEPIEFLFAANRTPVRNFVSR